MNSENATRVQGNLRRHVGRKSDRIMHREIPAGERKSFLLSRAIVLVLASKINYSNNGAKEIVLKYVGGIQVILLTNG